MPRGDRTGPNGMGHMTGRGIGYCNNFASPGYGKITPRGMGGSFGGRGGGYGRGYRNFANPRWNNAPINYDAKSQKAFLENDIEILSDQLEELKNRLSELSKEE
ncbi:MAG: DUF5320 domain-containing protein [Candidatus Cloacimonadales bacterium]|nr:DUF5320 domain-containing protein [Candidatus Cloacimonadales bacterium]